VSQRRKVLVIVGTRPEAVKMAPVQRALQSSRSFEPLLISTGQHRELLDDILTSLEMRADYRLDVMKDSQTPNDVLTRVVERLSPLVASTRPCAVLVQGDTTTVLAAALAGYHLRVPIAHVEAGLRTYDHANPFPEEANRQLVDRISRFCFAPTEVAKSHLLAEKIDPACVFVTGNTVIDSLLWAAGRSKQALPPNTLLITLHRRESFDGALTEILAGVADFLKHREDAHVFWPVHPNPNVTAAAEALGSHPRVTLSAPLDYVSFAGALATARVVLTDSGGLQEEGPSFGKTVLIARDATERTEALANGRNRLIGRTREGVFESLAQAWAEPVYGGPIPAESPFGDGASGRRIVDHLEAGL
jgi:UDP-N-acetylglucosamine 2-epimerase (non-hydrolysing)